MLVTAHAFVPDEKSFTLKSGATGYALNEEYLSNETFESAAIKQNEVFYIQLY